MFFYSEFLIGNLIGFESISMDPSKKKKLPSWLLLRNEEKLKTEAVERSPIFDRVKEFLPEIANANQQISDQDRGCLEFAQQSSDSESESESETKIGDENRNETKAKTYVEMNLSLFEYEKDEESDSEDSDESEETSVSDSSVPDPDAENGREMSNCEETNATGKKRRKLIEELKTSESNESKLQK